MSELLKNIDARTRLAGTNKLEILLFTLGVDARSGCRETYGINVFKVREVMRRPTITAAPDMPDAVQTQAAAPCKAASRRSSTSVVGLPRRV